VSMGHTKSPHYRRNAACLIADYVWFGVGMAMINGTTVLPSFVRHLTDSSVLVGLVGAIQTGGWLLPQIAAAGLVRGRARQKWFVVIPSAIGRPTFWISAATVVVLGTRNPGLTLAIFYLGFLLFSVADGMASVPWFDLFAKTIPTTRRGRVIGTAQVIYGILALGVGALIAYLLGPRSPLQFPNNYALLLFLSGLAFVVSLLAIALIREPARVMESPDSQRPRDYIRSLWHILLHDRNFVRLVAAQLLLGYGAMAYPFYVIYATENLGVSSEAIGLFVLIQTVGGILGGALLGRLNEKRGSLAVVRTNIALGLVAPLIPLLAHALSASVSGVAMPYVFALVFLAIGMANSSVMLGFMTSYLEISAEVDRPVYIGLANTLNALTLLAPLIGGWILQVTSYTYTVLFAASACCSALAFLPMTRISSRRVEG